jgi:hypothetical protein
MNRWRVGEDRGSKETDGCPLTGHAQQPTGTTAQAAEAHSRSITLLDDNNDGPQTAQWSGRGRGHAPQAQERDPPTAESYAHTISRLEATVDAYTRIIKRVDNNNDQPCQTARWSGGGPSRSHGHAP